MLSTTKRNVLTVKPKGFGKSLHLSFPDGGLSVCAACKRNCKTKHQCRSRDAHNEIPTRETFLCLILDPSCTDESQKLKNVSFVAKRIPPQPCQSHVDQLDCSMPVCSHCEKKNYSRAHCRLKKKHLDLPWTTTYFYLTALDDTAGQQVNFDCQPTKKRRVDNKEKWTPNKIESDAGVCNSEDLLVVTQSRALLARVSTKRNTVDSLNFDKNVLSNLSLRNCHQQPSTFYTKSHLLSQLKPSASDQVYNTSPLSGFKAPYLSKIPPHMIHRDIDQITGRASPPFSAPAEFCTSSLRGFDLNRLVSSECFGGSPESYSIYDILPPHSGSTNPVKLNKIYSHLCQIYQELNKIERDNRKRKQSMIPMSPYSLLSNNNI